MAEEAADGGAGVHCGVSAVCGMMQALTGYDYTGAYVAVTGGGAVELIVGGMIKIAEAREERKEKKRESGELETEADEP